MARDLLASNGSSVKRQPRDLLASTPQINPNLPEEMGAFGNVFNRPGAAVRGGIRETIGGGNFKEGYVKGSLKPSEIETFQDESIRKRNEGLNKTWVSKLPEGPQTAVRFAAGLKPSVEGFVADSATNPAEMALTLGTGGFGKQFANTKVGELIGKALNKPITPIKSTKNMISKVVKYPSKVEQAVGKNITPKASQAIFENTVGLPDDEVLRIKNTYANSVSPIADKLKTGIKGKVSDAKSLFEDTWNAIPEDVKINPTKFQSYLEQEIPNLEATLGKENPVVSTFRSMLEKTYREPSLTESLSGGIGNRLPRELSKLEATATRDSLNKLKGSDTNVNRLLSGAKDALYESAGDSGIKNIPQARSTYKAAKTNEGRYLNEYGDLRIPESRLEKIGLDELSKQDLDNLKELEGFLGDPFIDETSKINKIRQFEAEYRPEVLETKLKQVQKGDKFQLGENLKKLMGDKANPILKELEKNKHQKAIVDTLMGPNAKLAGGVGLGVTGGGIALNLLSKIFGKKR